MVGISFGSLYHIIDMAKPGSLGVTQELGMPNYSECISYSFSLLGGVDPGTTGTSHFVKNISILEGIWGALYSMLGLVNPVLQSRIDWLWFTASQVAFGIVAGLVVVRQTRRPTRENVAFALRAGVEAPGILPPRGSEGARP